jgi:hypothetical protein
MKPSRTIRTATSSSAPIPAAPVIARAVVLALAGAVAVASGACDTSSAPGGSTAAVGGSNLPPIGLAILDSDYASTSVSLYDPSQGRLQDDCIHTGALGAGRVDLSGDVTLSTVSSPVGREILVVDRGNATVSFVEPTCTLRQQISVSTGFKSNPRDVIVIDAHKAYVTRYETNAAPTPDPGDFDEGNDVLVVDPSTGAVTGRIDMAGQAAGDPTVLARPDRGVLVDGRAYVTLGNLSGDFNTAGPGRVVVIDTASDTILGRIDLPGQIGCSGIDYVAATKKLYVACGGDFSDPATQATASALVELDVGAAGSTLGALGQVVKADAIGPQPLNFVTPAVAEGIAYLEALGSLADPTSGTPASSDVLFAVALGTGDIAKVYDGGAFNLGRVAVLPEVARLFIPDGDEANPRVHVFDTSSGSISEITAFEANPAGKLPAREIVRY